VLQAGRKVVRRNVSFRDRYRSELRWWVLWLRGETFICWAVVRLENDCDDGIGVLTSEPSSFFSCA
jgi:hypothetical protein